MFLIKKLLGFLIKIILFLAILIGGLLILFNWPVKDKNENMQLGASFSSVYARDLGLDWKKTYVAVLDELEIKKIRVAAYWTEVEKEKGEYDFSDLDWQIEEAAKRDVDVILAFGIKAPRWPECFVPEFYKDDGTRERVIEREESLLKYDRMLVERYKKYDNIKVWQVENEPFLKYFGNCSPGLVTGDLLDEEIQKVRKVDDTQKPIMVTDSGELSLWFQAAKRSNIFGTSLYRMIHKEPYGYVTYPIGPNFFRIKALFIKYFVQKENIIISELQAEPWGSAWITDMTIEEQYKTMNPEKLRNIIDYAEKTGFSEAYFWGVEWWYWLKEVKGNDEMWQTGKKILGG